MMHIRTILAALTAVAATVASVLAAPPAAVQRQTLLIVSPRCFQKELQPFVEHKKQELSVESAALEDVLAQNQGVDDAEKLKHFLYQAWRQRHVHYVLLVGDSEVMPVRYMVLDRVEPAAFDYAFYPCDLYYADVAKADGSFDDWNARKEGFHARYFGEVRGEKNKTDPINYDAIHYRPQLALGRWPVNTAAEVRTMVAKSIGYEKRVAASPSHGRAAMICNSGWIDARWAMDEEAKALPKGWTIEKRYYSDAARKSCDPPPNHRAVINLLNAGVDLMLHAGHGSSDQWEQSLHAHNLRLVKNASHLPVMMSIGCNTAQFCALAPYEAYVDISGVEHKGTYAGEVFKAPPPPPAVYQKGRYNSFGLGKQLLRAGPNGAVAYIGCNTGGQPCGLALMDGFVKSWGGEPSARLGDCWMRAVSYYYDQEGLATIKPDAGWYPPSIFFQAMKYMVYGDPSLKLPH
ncbi:MAG: C25 family cysteine peptidase [Thermoguttaceae bacterium]